MITSLFKDEKELERLPKSLQKAVKNPATLELLKNISADLSLNQGQEENFTDIVFSIIKGEVELYDCASLISGVLKIDFDRALEINDRLYENLFFSIESDINNQFILYQKIKAPVKEAAVKDEDVKEIRKEKESHSPLVEKAVKKFNLFAAPSSVVPISPSVIPAKAGIQEKENWIPGQARNDTKEVVWDDAKENENLKKKFAEMAETFLSNVRTKAQFKSTLIKPVSDGGLGMEKQMADDVAEFFASYSRLQPVIARAPRSLAVPLRSLVRRAGEVGKSEEKRKTDSSVIARSPRRSNLVNSDGIATPSEGLAMTQKASLVPPNTKIEVGFEKSSFAEASEDREVKRMEKKVEKIKTQAPKLLSPSFVALAKNDVTEGVQSALAELNYTFPSSELQERLKSVIDARVRNVRNSIQTFDKLTQPISDGGMGFSKLEADKVSLVLNKYLEDKNKDIYGGKLAEIKKAEDEEKNKNAERARVAEIAEKNNLDERFTKMTGKASTPLPVIASPSASPAKPWRSGEGATISSKMGSPRPSAASGLAMTPKERPTLEDIKFTPKLAGPLEEIAQLTMDDFRKLSHDPKEAVLKIKDKLQLLRGESYKKYQAGIDAWRNSPLYGEYLKIINKSLFEGVPLDSAISSAKTLTKDEFDAIIESKIGD